MKIYISPSNQENNVGVGNYGTEESRMFQIAEVVKRELDKRKNIETKMSQKNFGWQNIVADSNGWGADYHFAIHSNAFNGQASGVEAFHYVDGKDNLSVKFSRRILNHYTKLYTGSNRGLKKGMNLFEVNDTIKGISCLIEIGFHDNWADATWIINNIEKIGINLAEGILEHLSADRGLDVGLKEDPAPPTPPAPQPSELEKRVADLEAKTKELETKLTAMAEYNNSGNLAKDVATKLKITT